VERPAAFRVEATYAAPPASEGGQFTVSAGGHTTRPFTIRGTPGGELFTEPVGFLWIRASGRHELVLTPSSLVTGQPLMTLASLRLVPVSRSED
jgi:hypothetical protein